MRMWLLWILLLPAIMVGQKLLPSPFPVGAGGGGGGGGGTAVAPYSTTVSGQTSVSIPAATHNQGVLAVAYCFDNSTPRIAVSCDQNYTRDSSGNLVFTFSPAFTGLIEVGSGGGVNGSGAGNFTVASPTVVGNLIFATNTLGTAGGDSGIAASAIGILSLWTGTKNSTTFPLGDGTMGTISSSFSGITSGSNSTAAMLVAPGASFGISVNGALSNPAFPLTGTWISGGSGTTTKPYLLIEPTSTTSTNWNMSGTGFGINAASGCSGSLLDFQKAAVRIFNVDCDGTMSLVGGFTATTVTAANNLRVNPGGVINFSNGVDYTNTTMTRLSDGIIQAGAAGTNSNGTWQGKHNSSDGTTGVSCSGVPTVSFASKDGVVTHC